MKIGKGYHLQNQSIFVKNIIPLIDLIQDFLLLSNSIMPFLEKPLKTICFCLRILVVLDTKKE